MKKRLVVIVALVMACLVPALAAAPVLAQDEAATRTRFTSALVVSAPQVARVGEAVEITVTNRAGAAIEGASVFALTREAAAAFRAAAADLRAQGTKLADIDIASLISGTSLGATNGDGKLEPAPVFDQTGGYILLAIKSGFLPGAKPIAIRDIPAVQGALAIHAPRAARVGTAVEITVTNRAGGAIEGASVFALTREQAAAFRSAVADLRAQGTKLADIDIASLITGTSLGTTNGDGKLEPAPVFDQTGGYILLAVKSGFLPGARPIFIAPETAPTPSPQQ